MRFAIAAIPWHTVPLLLPFLGLVTGILLYWKCSFDGYWGMAIAGCIAFVWLLFSNIINNVKNNFSAIGIKIIFISIGYTVSYHQDIRNDAQWYRHFSAAASSVQLEIISTPIPKTKIIQCEAKVRAMKMEDTWIPTVGIITLNFFIQADNYPFKAGDVVRIPNKLTPILNSGNPFNFRQADFAQLKGLYDQVFIGQQEVTIATNDAYHIPWHTRLRNHIIAVVQSNVHDTLTAGLINAVIVNERAQMDRAMWEDYTRTGIAHIVAISGMHITMFFIVLSALLFWISGRRNRWIRYAIAIPLIWIYILLTGFPPSAVRAGVMFTLLSIGIFTDRDANNINILFAAGIILLLYNTQWLFDVGFQLSFLSVLAIFIIYPSLSALYKPQNKFLKFVWNTVAVSASVQLLLSPMLLYYFNQIPIWSIIVNIPASAYSFVFMVLSIAIIALGSMGIPMEWCGSLVTTLTYYFNNLVQGFSSISPEHLYTIHIDAWQYWMLTIGILALIAYFIKKIKIGLWIGMAAFIYVIGLFIQDTLRSKHQQHIIVYNINNKSIISIIQGTQSQILISKEVEEVDYKYSTNAAHIGLMIQSVQQKPITPFEYRIQDKTILHLQGNQLPTIEGSVDILIITADTYIQPEQWKDTYNPKMVVMDASIRRSKQSSIQAAIEAAGMEVWMVQTQGAWSYPRIEE